ncbi:MAG: undecaprenyl/decaprenyl-phosphate alpha-N-acetylglucosaminyl 1-phosphate transferase [Chlorobiaceae bacterium]|nr:undecaprenyl/decaprenyl-phosphate alpha-N-acetylglucosaminyl 1-phosphate transferase [Chlorobiaceae bacterium]NTV25357.1 undecaprenyl/decaprenyl-phosphate alpha-N-acetylglucosaminyl 1-phosphate transferase [Chlorobiaceae bacterium]
MAHYLLIFLLGLFLAGLSATGHFAFGATGAHISVPANDYEYWVRFLGASVEHGKVYLVSLFVAHLSIRRLSASAEKLKLVDMPDNNRKVHTVAKPLVGGLGIVAGVLVSMVLFFPVAKYLGLIISILMILIMGVIDDRHDISFKIRLIVQVTATAITMNFFPGMHLVSFGNLFGLGEISSGMLVIPVTVFCALGVINAINMIDGLDGLAGTTSLIAFVSFAVLAWMNDMGSFMLLSLAFAGAIAAFLRFNWYPSRLFMGDAGSMTLGFVLAFFSVELSQKPGGIISPVAVLIVLAIPVTDTLTVMSKRIMSGKSPFSPDKTHFHHILRDMGFNHAGVVLIITGIATLFSLFAIVATVFNVPDYVLFGVFVSWFVFYFVSSTSRKGLFSAIGWMQKHHIISHEDVVMSAGE